MNVEGIQLAWIVVKDFQAALKFYTDVVGLTIQNQSPEYGWAELSGPKGFSLGIAQENPQSEIPAGGNAVVTISVKNIEKARNAFSKKGARLVGDVLEIPGHVKMQTFTDGDGNMMQLVEQLEVT